jgi:hypothetical protein
MNFKKIVSTDTASITRVVIKFGLPAFFTALAGAYLLLRLGNLEPLYSYTIMLIILSIALGLV